MLHNINLMDWRHSQQRRQSRRLALVLVYGCSVVVCCQFTVFILWKQQACFLHDKQAQLTRQNVTFNQKINAWQKQQQIFVVSTTRFHQLQSQLRQSRIPTQLMSLLAEETPEGVYVEKVHLLARIVTIDGLGINSQRVARFTRQLKRNNWVRHLQLESVTARAEHWGERLQSFRLSFAIDKQGVPLLVGEDYLVGDGHHAS
jgi:Tfp pilus assembly protein PilN